MSVAVVALLRSLGATAAAAAAPPQRVPQRKNVSGEWLSFEEAEAESQVSAALSHDAPLHAPMCLRAHVALPHTSAARSRSTLRAAALLALAPTHRTHAAHQSSRALLSLPRHAGRALGVA